VPSSVSDSFPNVNYQARRDAIASLVSTYSRGDRIPEVEYTEEEHRVWRLVFGELRPRHQKFAAREFLNALDRLGLPSDHIPQLQDIADRLEALTGFRIQPAGGVVAFREFCGSLADGYLCSTQYIRDGSLPFYSAEPDVLHEVIGHGGALTDERFAQLYRIAGEATRRVQTDRSVQFIAKVFWFTLECGLIDEAGGRKAYGASIVSSYGELERFQESDIRPLEIFDMVHLDYDITKYQTTLYSARSLSHIEDIIGEFWSFCDDDSIERLLAVAK
jgi:phenylalanine-4-hydroxylase